MSDRDQLQKIILPLYQAADEKHFETAFEGLKDYITQKKLIPESKSDTQKPLALDLLKVLFQHRNRITPQGICPGFHSNLHLLKSSADHYQTNYLSFGNNNDDPYTPKNLFCFQKILGLAQLVQANCDRGAIKQGVYWLLVNSVRLSRDSSSFFDSDPNWLVGINWGVGVPPFPASLRARRRCARRAGTGVAASLLMSSKNAVPSPYPESPNLRGAGV